MSLVNNYLKRLVPKSTAEVGNGGGVVPPSLQRLQNESRKPAIGKKIIKFIGLVVVVSCSGIILVSVITLLFSPAVVESVAVERTPTPINSSTKDVRESQISPQKVVGTVMHEPQAQTMKDNDSESISVPVTGEVIVAQNNAIDTPQKRENDKFATEVSRKSTPPVPVHLQSGSVVKPEENTTDVSGTIEGPRPLAETWQAADEPTSSSNMVQNTSNKVVLKESQNTPDYIYQLGLQAQHSNKYGRAERYYRIVLQELPEHENALVNLSAMYIQEKRFQEAQVILDKVIGINPKNTKALVNTGMIVLAQNNKQSAADYFLQALRYNPIEETALTNMAYLAQLDKRYDEASDYFEKLIRIAPEKTDILLAYAGLEEKKEKYKSAIKLYRQCLDQLSMQKNPERFEQITVRIQTLKQFSAEQAY